MKAFNANLRRKLTTVTVGQIFAAYSMILLVALGMAIASVPLGYVALVVSSANVVALRAVFIIEARLTKPKNF